MAQLALAGCAGKPEQQLPQLVIGYSTYRPYIFIDDDGEVAGSDAMLAREACARMGYEPVFKEIVWQDRDLYLKSGEVDCLWSCFSMDGREDEYSWVGPYMMSREVVAVLVSSSINSLADLKNKRIGVKVSTKPEEIFLERTDKRVPKVSNVFSLSSAEELAVALRNEYVDACSGHAAALRDCFQTADVAYRFLDEVLLYVRLGVAFSKQRSDGVQEQMNAAFEEMLLDGTTRQVLLQAGLDADNALEGVSGHE